MRHTYVVDAWAERLSLDVPQQVAQMICRRVEICLTQMTSGLTIAHNLDKEDDLYIIMRMRIAIAADHGGFALKTPLVHMLLQAGHDVQDLGAYNDERSDYPDFSKAVGEVLQRDKADRGIVICGSGVGACVAANKMRGIRACVCHDTYSAHQGVEHDDMNVLCMGARVIGPALVPELVDAFLRATFSSEERHHRRVGKIHNLEEKGTVA